MKRTLSFVLACTLLYASSCKNDNQSSDSNAIKASVADVQKEKIARGGYLVATIGCTDCHSPKKMGPQGPEPDMDRFLSGFNANDPVPSFDQKGVKEGQFLVFNGPLTAFAGPWGISFAANLTPDATGIGNWSLDQFKKALREGKSKGLDGNRMLLPPMPWQNFSHLTDDDLEAIFMYLKTIKPIDNKVPAPIPPKA